MKKAVLCGAMVLGLAGFGASARAALDPFTLTVTTPTTVIAIRVSGTTTTATVTRPLVVAPLRPPLISPIR
jgi:hypothetical protein